MRTLGKQKELRIHSRRMNKVTGLNGLSAYQQSGKVWNQTTKTADTGIKSGVSATSGDVKTNTFKPIDTASSLVPSNRDGIGMSIGDVELSDKAKDYYSKLKAKFGNMQFIAVSGAMKEQVKANAAAYGNASKMVVLIDEAKLEQMANDESFRKKYEGIIAMSQSQMLGARNSLASSGAGVKNFGMSVNLDGSTSFFATLEKSSADQAKRIEKKHAENKAAKVKEQKEAKKKAQEKRLEEAKEERKAKRSDSTDRDNKTDWEDKEYVKIEADSMDELVDMVSKYAYDNYAKSVMTDTEKSLGQNFDFKG